MAGFRPRRSSSRGFNWAPSYLELWKAAGARSPSGQVDGEVVLPVARYVRPGTATNRQISSDISISIPLPDPTPQFRSNVSRQFLLLNRELRALTLPEASVDWWDLTYSLEPEVPGLSFDAETRRLTGIPTQAGVYSMVYRATSSGGGAAERRFTIEVGVTDRSAYGEEADGMSDDYDGAMMADDSMMDDSSDSMF